MNRRVLMLLKSDCGNHSMIKIYHELTTHGFILDVCSNSFAQNDLYDFDGIRIKSVYDISIDDYEVLIVTRNIFDYPISADKIINYKGIIISDNTTFYEGNDVFGDVVFTSGKNNYDIMRESGIELPVIPVGCIKCKFDYSSSKQNNVVWIESGHFPFGKKGRFEIAEIINAICEQYPDYTLTVKPRYLLKDCRDATHYNADHIYNYLDPIAQKHPNLKLIHTNYDLSDVIKNAQTVIHTYSSAFQEAIVLGKRILNIGEISSDETVDLRNNRYQKIKKYIDRAGCTVSKRDILSVFPQGFRVESSFDGVSINPGLTPIQNTIVVILDIVEKWYQNKWLVPDFYSSASQMNYINKKPYSLIQHRVRGALNHIVAKQEYFLDDYSSFSPLRKQIAHNALRLDNIELEIDNVIKTNFSLYNKSIFNQPYLMKKEFESGRFDPNRPWDELLCPESYLYFSGMTFYLNNDRKKAIDCLERYLSLVESKAFAETLIDKPSYQISAKKTIKNINKTI